MPPSKEPPGLCRDIAFWILSSVACADTPGTRGVSGNCRRRFFLSWRGTILILIRPEEPTALCASSGVVVCGATFWGVACAGGKAGSGADGGGDFCATDENPTSTTNEDTKAANRICLIQAPNE